MPAAPVIGAVAGVAGSVVSANKQAKAARQATDAQVTAARDQIELDKAIYEDQKKMFGPYYQSGRDNQAILDYEMGIGPKPVFGAKAAPKVEEILSSAGGTTSTPGTPMNALLGSFMKQMVGVPNKSITSASISPTVIGFKVGDRTFTKREDAQAYADSLAVAGTEYQGFKATPDYAFRVKSANDALENSVATRGSLFSGQTLKDLTQLNQDLADAEYNQYIARLEAGANRGQAAAGSTAAAAGNMGSNVGASRQGMANAIGEGAVARANAFNSGVSGVVTGISNLFAPKPIVSPSTTTFDPSRLTGGGR